MADNPTFRYGSTNKETVIEAIIANAIGWTFHGEENLDVTEVSVPEEDFLRIREASRRVLRDLKHFGVSF